MTVRVRPAVLVSLALRGLAAGRGTTAMLVLAIAIAAGFQIPNAANLAGLEVALLEDGLARGTGDVGVEPIGKPRFANGAVEAARLRELTGARAAVPTLTFAGAIGNPRRKTVPFFGLAIHGIDVESPGAFHIVQGEPLAPGDTTGILVGVTAAARLGIGVGDTVDVRVIYGAADKTLGESNLGRFTMTVRGTVNGMAGAYRFAFVDRAWLGEQAGVPNAATSIALHLDDHDSARTTAAAIREKRPDVAAFAWQDEEAGFASYIEAKRLIGRVSYAMVIAAIAIPTWALLYIQVLRRRRELAILRAIGFLRRELFAICVLQAIAIGVIGCALGAALGYGLIRYFDSNPLFAWESLTVRPVADLASFAVPAIVILATAVIAVLHPAYRASRVDPAPALRRIE